MAVIVTAFDVVVRVSALANGAEAFGRSVGNQTFCTDGRIARVSFMNATDRDDFVLGLARLSPDDVAQIDRHAPERTPPWLGRGRHAGVEAVWLASDPARDPLVVPLAWQPRELELESWDSVREHLEYLGSEGNVEVYLDKRTGRKVYTGRIRQPVSPAAEARVAAIKAEAAALLGPLLGKRSLGFFERRKLAKAAELYGQVLTVVPGDWSSAWSLGMCHRTLGDEGPALDAFRRAYAHNPGHPDVGRELAGQLMRLEQGDEAIRVSRELCARFPEELTLLANCALAHLLFGDLGEAAALAERAQALDPSDRVTASLRGMIERVRAGAARRPRPHECM
ncbi:MAG: tetratricopeptide repeat protein [Myxococcales bacterium]|jgi:hypothetical protein|nr:tetratricopeptide repeat protein [Myxococcales bacterium]